MPDLSIVIVSYNTRELTERCLRSLFAFTRDLPIEVIVVDNASEDGTARRVREEFPDIQLVENTTNVGFARACNQGLRRARGRYLMLLNSDTELCADVLGPLLRRLDAHPEVGAAGPRLIYPDGRTQHYSAARAKSLLGTLAQYSIPRRREIPLYLKPLDPSGSFYETESISGAAMIVRREVLETVGLLDEGFFLYGEDADWIARMRRAGYKVACAPDLILLHHHGASSRQDEQRREIEAVKSNLRYFAKHGGRWHVLLFRLGLALILILRMLSLDLARALFRGNRTRLRRDAVLLKYALAHRVTESSSCACSSSIRAHI
ncbi:MAG: glycosyltransferase family 2 protein [Blastocatellia bacterium]|nr:glycosyltransferase family 2 protein [Blastocatellia bacterium]MCS7156901.1 glycosyltransferase family 2 protein [Blastocatellia bacterium]MCX7752100.1 glycosyltransferase family 2 protein [Blastocatellia bacterium]MDW8167593.1 glycosyltransferase family 2 protein [Acidobacteriota bacterium]MDW8256193.1 glycosyltransferase family 2 protein [Acidobacteriota bacterium]